MAALRDPAHEKELLAAAAKSLRELDTYYKSVRLNGPAKTVHKAAALLAFIRRVR